MDPKTYGNFPAAIRLVEIIEALPDGLRPKVRSWWSRLYSHYLLGMADLEVVEHRFTHRLLWWQHFTEQVKNFLPENADLEKFRTFASNVLRRQYKVAVQGGGNLGCNRAQRNAQRARQRVVDLLVPREYTLSKRRDRGVQDT